MDDEFDVDIVQAGEDDVPVVCVAVDSPEGVPVLQLPLEVSEAGEVVSLRCRWRRGGYLR